MTDLLTTAQVAARLGVSQRSVDRFASREFRPLPFVWGNIRSQGGRKPRLFDPEEVDRWWSREPHRIVREAKTHKEQPNEQR